MKFSSIHMVRLFSNVKVVNSLLFLYFLWHFDNRLHWILSYLTRYILCQIEAIFFVYVQALVATNCRFYRVFSVFLNWTVDPLHVEYLKHFVGLFINVLYNISCCISFWLKTSHHWELMVIEMKRYNVMCSYSGIRITFKQTSVLF